eukprot:PLAT3302.15.p6 GENE.PLAT3302.15~~PLAT3302.15.p6  ORF type:complete len:142 (+),score=31.06 PLAT3302.15:6937-7362(+)
MRVQRQAGHATERCSGGGRQRHSNVVPVLLHAGACRQCGDDSVKAGLLRRHQTAHRLYRLVLAILRVGRVRHLGHHVTQQLLVAERQPDVQGDRLAVFSVANMLELAVLLQLHATHYATVALSQAAGTRMVCQGKQRDSKE